MAADAKALAAAMRQTLNLPRTSFPMRANAAVREPQLHARCVSLAYKDQPTDRLLFVLHDGPPFANGSLHMGHFLNKTLKDVINRYQRLRGRRVCYVPGWDCHGLPIEHKALTQLQLQASELSPAQVRALSRQLARSAVQEQQKDFERWGVLADWSGADGSVYLTMNPSYEAKQYDVLKQMVHDGLIFRGFKPVYWSPSSRTALAEAELEYQDDHVSHAAYVQFHFASSGAGGQETATVLSKYGDKLSAVVWTTTPWTIPSNQALCVNAELDYVVVRPRNADSDACYLIASALQESFATVLQGDAETDVELEVLETLKGASLEGLHFTHPLVNRQAVVLVGEHVTTDAGTGVVHTAPGHGQDDYFAWMAHLSVPGEHPDILCPVDADGCFTAEAGDGLEGLSVLDEGNAAVIDQLKNSGNLLSIGEYHHRYPYDWRTKKPVILRATAQWFARLDALHERGKRVLEESVEMVPPSARRRLEATLSSRHEWCISRQRSWGLPIPVFYHKVTGEPLITEATIAHLQDIVKSYSVKGEDGQVEREGADCWWDLSVRELLPESLQDQAENYEKGTDTLDVWFDSGSSWHAVLPGLGLKENADGQLRADVYLEGSDQHRGWFQSSLLTSLAMQGTAPYKNVITHGFTLDERGSKMSKSLGNTIVPNDFINGCTMPVPVANSSSKKKAKKNSDKPQKAPKVKQVKVPAYGADVLRFWVATTDYTGDVSVGPAVVGKASDALRKVRNTARFLLGNLQDFDPAQHAVPHAEMDFALDRYMLHELNALAQSVTSSYDAFAFNRAQHALSHFISTDLSAFYMEATKDRLYCDASNSKTRRAAQTVLWLSLQSITRALAPVIPHTTEDIRLHWVAQLQDIPLEDVPGSLFLEEGWMPSAAEWQSDDLARDWTAIRQLRFEVNRVVEQMRQAGRVGSQLECNVYVVASNSDPRVKELLSPLAGTSQLEDVLLCSDVQVVESVGEIDDVEQFQASCQLAMGPNDAPMDVKLVLTAAKGHKCPRCWKYAPEVDAAETHLCMRCAQATDLRSVEDLAKKLIEDSA